MNLVSVRTHSLPLALLAAGWAIASGGCGGAPPMEAELGQIEFPNSGARAAQPAFLRGVLLLHSFEYDDAHEEFRRAQQQDPDFALAYWGEAMTHEHPLWNQQEREEAQAALARLAPSRGARLAKAATERERGYLEAAEILFGEGPLPARRRGYSEAMRRLHETDPGDQEAAAFYALSILGTAAGERDFRTYMKAAAVAEELFARNRRHPGAAHYLIHSYDDPVHAPLGLRAARVYARIAPAAAHAQHMPSHIFVALGMWEQALASNVASWEAAEQRVERKGLDVDERGYHALWWLEYCYLQLGEFDKARRQLAIIEQDAIHSGSVRTRTHLAFMRAHYLIETGRWNERIARPDLAGLGPNAAAADLLADGMQAVAKGDLVRASKFLRKLQDREGEAARTPSLERAVNVAARELEAWRLFAAGDQPLAFARIAEAAEWEDSMSYFFGPPIPPKPAHELWGEMLLEAGLAAEAEKQFRLALERSPGRRLSLAGLRRARTAAKMP